MHRAMTRIGRLGTRYPWRVLAAWLLVTLAVAALVVGFGRPTDEDASLPGSDAQVGRDLVDRHFPGTDTATGSVILRAGTGAGGGGGRVDDPQYRQPIADAVARISRLRHVSAVVPPSTATGSLSTDGRIGYLTVTFDVGPREVDRRLAEDVLAAAAPAGAAGLEVLPGGAVARPEADTRRSEALGLGVALVVLVVAFGGLVAAALPVLTALITLVVGVGTIGLAGHLTGVPAVATTLATMIGLGVGVDYALFLITRYRGLLAEGRPTADAIVATVASSGSAVVFAGGTVIIALAGLAVAGVPILATLGWSAGLVVLVAVAAATTLLPALLTLLGGRIDALRVRRPRGRGEGSSAWGRLADRVTRRPWPYALGTAALLLALAAPALGMTVGQTDPGDFPAGTPSRAGYEAMAEGFGPGSNGPLTVVAELDPPASGAADRRVQDLAAAVGRTAGVRSVQQPRVSADGAVVTVRAVPTTAPGEPATQDTVAALRALSVPGTSVHVTGQTAIRGALADRVTERMPVVIGLVVLLSALLVLAAFRAPVVAVKAAVMNLLSVTAAYGVLTAVFQHGWGVGLTGLDGPVPIEAYLPMMLFALLFGLSMDYEVFLLTAVREAWQATGDNRRSVRDGITGTGVVITSAALIMVCVFVSFLLNPSPVVKMMGLGMAVAVAVDATVIRGVLVPATMALLGRANWWTPARRRRPDGGGSAPPGSPGRGAAPDAQRDPCSTASARYGLW